MGLKAQGLGMMVSPRLCTRRFVFLDTGVGCSFGDLQGAELCSFEDGRTCSSNLLSIGGEEETGALGGSLLRSGLGLPGDDICSYTQTTPNHVGELSQPRAKPSEASN